MSDDINHDLQELPPPRTKFKQRLAAHRWRPDGTFDLSDSDDESKLKHSRVYQEQLERDRQLALARRACRRWWTLSHLPGHPGLVEERNEQFSVSWTRAVAPRLEGRIRIIGK